MSCPHGPACLLWVQEPGLGLAGPFPGFLVRTGTGKGKCLPQLQALVPCVQTMARDLRTQQHEEPGKLSCVFHKYCLLPNLVLPDP